MSAPVQAEVIDLAARRAPDLRQVLDDTALSATVGQRPTVFDFTWWDDAVAFAVNLGRELDLKHRVSLDRDTGWWHVDVAPTRAVRFWLDQWVTVDPAAEPCS